ncbi:hypothetical protein BDZ88DRAFT_413892 [Geranomyces variabilis]|nr:hypothetical protein BDZ88DRAFT_413892 [Geranomyces variabilis]KAJ3137120.1 hypothetical protein HDU90_002292 [Geranomyces variabilis]
MHVSAAGTQEKAYNTAVAFGVPAALVATGQGFERGTQIERNPAHTLGCFDDNTKVYAIWHFYLWFPFLWPARCEALVKAYYPHRDNEWHCMVAEQALSTLLASKQLRRSANKSNKSGQAFAGPCTGCGTTNAKYWSTMYQPQIAGVLCRTCTVLYSRLGRFRAIGPCHDCGKLEAPTWFKDPTDNTNPTRPRCLCYNCYRKRDKVGTCDECHETKGQQVWRLDPFKKERRLCQPCYWRAPKPGTCNVCLESNLKGQWYRDKGKRICKKCYDARRRASASAPPAKRRGTVFEFTCNACKKPKKAKQKFIDHADADKGKYLCYTCYQKQAREAKGYVEFFCNGCKETKKTTAQ